MDELGKREKIVTSPQGEFIWVSFIVRETVQKQIHHPLCTFQSLVCFKKIEIVFEKKVFAVNADDPYIIIITPDFF